MKKLWTGKTPREALVFSVETICSAKGLTAAEGLEHALDGAEQCPDGSEKREALRYWESASSQAQARVLAECRSCLKASDRLMGRKVNR